MSDTKHFRPGKKLDALEKLAWYLDSSIRIPGTKWTVGFDGLLGLIPGVGDLTSGAVSGYILLQAIKRGVPPIVVAKMLVNIALDTILGVIPVIGDIFDLAFKANQRNVKLIHSYEQNPIRIKNKSRLSFAVFLLLVIASLVLIFWVALLLLTRLFHLIF